MSGLAAGGLAAGGLVASGLAGCATSACPEPTRPGRGLWLRRGGEDVIRRFEGVEPATFPDSTPCGTVGFDAERPFRVASISKLAVAETARAMADAGEGAGRLSLDADVSDALGMRFRHPFHPDTPISLRHLLGHLSGIADPAKYWVAAPGDIRSVLTPDIWAADATPGQFFRYSNLGYGIAATVMEAVGGERFDRLAARHALGRVPGVGEAVKAGFNWSGMGEGVASGVALWRGAPAAWEAQVDDAEMRAQVQLTGLPSILAEDGLDLADYLAGYRPGTNGTLLSPQGGLRASFADLMAMGEAWLSEPDPQVLWDAARDPGDTADGHFVQFGLGRYIYPPERSPLPGVRVVGHAGEAYGFYGGLWSAPALDAVWTFGVLGSPGDGVAMTGGRPNLRTTNAAFMDEVANVLL